MTALSDLIARLEAAKEGSRELDALIFTEVFEAELRPWSPTRRVRTLWWFKRNSEQVLRYGKDSHPHYTTSLDAALTLVPENMRIELIGSGSAWRCEVRHFTAYERVAEYFGAPTPALALCIAALKARDSK